MQIISFEKLNDNCYISNTDCLESMKYIPDDLVDLVLCDLPYGTTACSWDIIIPFDKLWKEYNRIIQEYGTIILFGSEPFSTKLRTSNLDMYRYDYIWIKNNCSNFQLANIQPLKFHENISIFYKDILHTEFSDIIKEQMNLQNISFKELSRLCLSKNGNETGWLSNKIKGTQIPTRDQWQILCNYLNIKNDYEDIVKKLKQHTYNCDFVNCNVVRNNKNKGGKLGHFSENNNNYTQYKTNYNKSILYFDRVSKPIHPTQKPVELLEWLIKTYTNENNVVLDNCMGSGSTGVACLNTNRVFIGIEKDKKYYEIAKQRLLDTISKNKSKLF